jgi:hypothetical protein
MAPYNSERLRPPVRALVGCAFAKTEEIELDVQQDVRHFLRDTTAWSDARMVKLVDTRDLKSLDPNRSCRFDSGSGHQCRRDRERDLLETLRKAADDVPGGCCRSALFPAQPGQCARACGAVMM